MAKVPLAAGLRAAAEETDNQRVSRALLWIADQADQGRSLEDTLTHSGKLLPTYVSGLILAALRTGTLGEALFDLVEQQQSLQGIRRGIFDGLLYPLIVLVMAVAVLLLARLLCDRVRRRDGEGVWFETAHGHSTAVLVA